LTDKKNKSEEKAEDNPKEHKEKPEKKSQPDLKETVEGDIFKDQKGKDTVKTLEEEKSDDKIDVEPDLEPSPEKGEIEEKLEEENEEIRSEETTEPAVKASEVIEEEPVPEKKPVKEKHGEKKPGKKKEDADEDFQYIVRIANADIDGNKNIVMGLAQIKGIGRHMASLIADATGLDKKLKMGKLTEQQIEKIKTLLEDIEKIAPGWMLNHRKDIDSGKDIHLLSTDVDLKLRDDVNLLKMIRSYRGIRHESSLPVRGQRTRANNRRGLALGVSKKRPGT